MLVWDNNIESYYIEQLTLMGATEEEKEQILPLMKESFLSTGSCSHILHTYRNSKVNTSKLYEELRQANKLYYKHLTLVITMKVAGTLMLLLAVYLGYVTGQAWLKVENSRHEVVVLLTGILTVAMFAVGVFLLRIKPYKKEKDK